LTGWARHTFDFGDSHSLGLTFGIIDATDYVDEAYLRLVKCPG
jgi:porin